MSETINANVPVQPTRWMRATHFAKRNPPFVIGLVIIAILVFGAVFAPWVAPYDPSGIDFSAKLVPPGLAHPFGTDDLGRDILSRVIYGGRTSLSIGLAVVGISLVLGLPAGVMAGYYGGRLDAFIMRICDVFLAFPPLLLPIALVAAMGPSLFNAMLAVAISWFPWYARIVRASVMTVRGELYVDAARAMGVRDRIIMVRHALPNATTPVMVQASLDFGYAILATASLSFIGVGAKPPTIEWGLMVALSRSKFLDFWWTAAFPGLAVFLAVLAINLVGDGVRDLLDPKRRQA